jgi:hypothetical protein
MKVRLILTLTIIFWGVTAGTITSQIACAEQRVVAGNDAAQRLSMEEQKKAAYEIFKEILRLSDGPERGKNLPTIKALYRKIIETYPELGLAQESYMRLVILALEEKTPAGNEEAESVYRECLEKYPDARLRKVIENEFNRK